MFASFSTALSALDANGVAVGVVGNNLANLNTPGYKESTAYFRDLVSESLAAGQTQLGFGVAAPLTIRQFSQGAIQTTNGSLDAAIQGDGFFVVQNGAATQYTREGNFQVDLNGNLITPTGEQVQGWMASNGAINTGGPIGNIQVPVGTLQAPAATQNITLDANMDAASAPDATSAWSTPVTVYDSLGTAHVLTINFQRIPTPAGAPSPNTPTWSYTVTIPGADVGQPGGPVTLSDSSNNAAGPLEFGPNANGQDGQLISPAAGTSISFDITGFADGAQDIKGLNWNLFNADGSARITQYDQSSAASANSQDGVEAAQLTQVNMGNGGQVIASYSDGQKVVVAQLALASIRNPQTLVAEGDNNYGISADTAAPAVGTPGTGGRGTVVGSALESSNVDIASELTKLIVLQSAYQAASKVVTTVNTLAQATTSLIP